MGQPIKCKTFCLVHSVKCLPEWLWQPKAFDFYNVGTSGHNHVRHICKWFFFSIRALISYSFTNFHFFTKNLPSHIQNCYFKSIIMYEHFGPTASTPSISFSSDMFKYILKFYQGQAVKNLYIFTQNPKLIIPQRASSMALGHIFLFSYNFGLLTTLMVY